MAKRTITALVLFGVALPAVIAGGVWFFAVIALFMGLAAWEYVGMYRRMGQTPAMALTVGGALVMLAVRTFWGEAAVPTLGALILLAMGYHLVQYERGDDLAGMAFPITVTGILYFGWLGSYIIALRNLPDLGVWWLMLVLPSVWFADSAAYFIGVRWGRHKMVPRLSPKKSWEGYWGGVVFGVLLTIGLAAAYHTWAQVPIEPWQAGLLGLILSILPTMGDLGESMIKREAHIKDSSNIIPGHGGAFDRIDSWLWGGFLGYYFIIWFVLGL